MSIILLKRHTSTLMLAMISVVVLAMARPASADSLYFESNACGSIYVNFSTSPAGGSGSGTCGGGSYAYNGSFGGGLVLGASASGTASESVDVQDFGPFLTGGPVTPVVKGFFGHDYVDCTGRPFSDCYGYLRLTFSIEGTVTGAGEGQLFVTNYSQGLPPGMTRGGTFTFYGDTSVVVDVPLCVNAELCVPGEFTSQLVFGLRAIANGGSANFLNTLTITSAEPLDFNKQPYAGSGLSSTLPYPLADPSPATVPEPSTFALLSASLIGVVHAGARRRRRRT